MKSLIYLFLFSKRFCNKGQYVHLDSNSKWLEMFALLEANVNITNEELSNSPVKTCNLQLVYVCIRGAPIFAMERVM